MKTHTQSIAQAGIMVLIGVWIMLLLNSCSTSRNAPYRDPVKSPDTYVRKPHSNCGWAYN